MTTTYGQTVGAVLLVCVSAVACDGPTRPAPIAPIPVPPLTNTLDGLDGDYTLTIDLPAACAELPEAERRRTYDATFGPTPYAYLTIRIVGEGYDLPTVTGDMRSDGEGRVTFNWNNFDIGGCDGWPERLPDGGTLMICGSAVGVVDGTTITANLGGQVVIGAQGKPRQFCGGTFPFTFRRPAGATSH